MRLVYVLNMSSSLNKDIIIIIIIITERGVPSGAILIAKTTVTLSRFEAYVLLRF